MTEEAQMTEWEEKSTNLAIGIGFRVGFLIFYVLSLIIECSYSTTDR